MPPANGGEGRSGAGQGQAGGGESGYPPAAALPPGSAPAYFTLPPPPRPQLETGLSATLSSIGLGQDCMDPAFAPAAPPAAAAPDAGPPTDQFDFEFRELQQARAGLALTPQHRHPPLPVSVWTRP